MGRENPLVTLGLPKRVLVREHAFGAPREVLKLAEANFRTLTKRYHPDLPGGDAELMTELGEAIEELRDIDALEFYIEEIVSTDDVEALYQQKQAQKLVSRDQQVLTRMASGFAYVDQYEALGISGPTSYIAQFDQQMIIVEVISSTSAQASITGLIEIDANADVVRKDGKWAANHFEGYKERWVRIDEFVSQETVKVVGFAPCARHSVDKLAARVTSQRMLEAYDPEHRLAWLAPQESWFLPDIVFRRKNLESTGLVLCNQGRFAVTGDILGVASM